MSNPCREQPEHQTAPLFDWDGTDSDVPVISSLESLVELVEARATLYIRYSEGPETDIRDGPSCDYEAELVLPGLSVATLTQEPWWGADTRAWVVRRVCKYRELAIRGRFAWALTGDHVARGPDHEPLVRSARPVARLADEVLSAAENEYRSRFCAGRDSTGPM